MNINRHNYESFFMLYIDNELSVEERKAVEIFVKENADLKLELCQLQLSVLPNQAFTFENKEQLLKSETISAADEENLWLLLDEELNAEETLIIEGKISSETAWAKEWDLIKRTRLDAVADEIIFENKELLYRKEEKIRPLFFMARWAAAAVVIGIGFYTGFQLLQKDETNLPTEIAPVKTAQINNNDLKNIKNTLADVENKNSSINNVPVEKKQHLATTLKEEITPSKKIKPINNNIEKLKPTTPETKKQPFEKETVLLASNYQHLKIKNHNAIKIDPEIAIIIPAKRTELVDINIMDAAPEKNALLTAFKENKDGDRILYMNKEVIEKTKVGKFLKKVKNSLSGDIEVKAEKTLKIAGFEIALK